MMKKAEKKAPVTRVLEKVWSRHNTVSDQPQVAAVPVRRDLERDRGEGAPLVDRDD